MENNNVSWVDIIGGVALGFLTGLLLDEYKSDKVEEKDNKHEEEDLGYAVIVEDE